MAAQLIGITDIIAIGLDVVMMLIVVVIKQFIVVLALQGVKMQLAQLSNIFIALKAAAVAEEAGLFIQYGNSEKY